MMAVLAGDRAAARGGVAYQKLALGYAERDATRTHARRSSGCRDRAAVADPRRTASAWWRSWMDPAAARRPLLQAMALDPSTCGRARRWRLSRSRTATSARRCASVRKSSNWPRGRPATTTASAATRCGSPTWAADSPGPFTSIPYPALPQFPACADASAKRTDNRLWARREWRPSTIVPMSELRIEKHRVEATVMLSDGRSMQGCVFVSAFNVTHSGPESVKDLMNDGPGILPLRAPGGTRARGSSAQPPARAVCDAGQRRGAAAVAGDEVATRRPVSVLLDNGDRLDGFVPVAASARPRPAERSHAGGRVVLVSRGPARRPSSSTPTT